VVVRVGDRAAAYQRPSAWVIATVYCWDTLNSVPASCHTTDPDPTPDVAAAAPAGPVGSAPPAVSVVAMSVVGIAVVGMATD
jgi:hypothetical protein